MSSLKERAWAAHLDTLGRVDDDGWTVVIEDDAPPSATAAERLAFWAAKKAERAAERAEKEAARAAAQAAFDALPPEVRTQYKRRSLLSKYGVTPERYVEMHAEQRGACAICADNDASGRWLAVDHDHDTGAVRGLLCSACNTSLGGFNDDPVLLRRALTYLEERS